MKDKKHILNVVQGVEGKSVYLNDTRIDGNKPWGGGKSIANFFVSAQDLIDNVPELKALQQPDKTSVPQEVVSALLSADRYMSVSAPNVGTAKKIKKALAILNSGKEKNHE